jgi:hypothetical protein
MTYTQLLPVTSLARDDSEVGVAQAGRCDSNDDLPGPGARFGHVLEFRRCLRLSESVCQHHVRDCTTRVRPDLLHDGIGDTLVGGGKWCSW